MADIIPQVITSVLAKIRQFESYNSLTSPCFTADRSIGCVKPSSDARRIHLLVAQKILVWHPRKAVMPCAEYGDEVPRVGVAPSIGLVERRNRQKLEWVEVFDVHAYRVERIAKP